MSGSNECPFASFLLWSAGEEVSTTKRDRLSAPLWRSIGGPFQWPGGRVQIFGICDSQQFR